jgi:hypothetical protein
VLVEFRDPEGPGGRTKQLRPHSEIKIKCLEKGNLERTRDDGEGRRVAEAKRWQRLCLLGPLLACTRRILADAGSNITRKLPPADWFGYTEPSLFRILPF